MNFIREIREIIGDNVEVVKFAFWKDEMAVYVWEKEIPISVFPKLGYGGVVLDADGYSWKLTAFQVLQLGKIMEILQNNIEEIKELTKET